MPFLRWRREVFPDQGPATLEMAALFTDELRDRYTPPHRRVPPEPRETS